MRRSTTWVILISFTSKVALSFTPNVLPTTSRERTVDGLVRKATLPYKSDSFVDQSPPREKDAVLRSAYDEWRNEYKKGDFDAARFENFKVNYAATMESNRIAEKEALERGDPPPSWLTLNEFADLSMADYEKMFNESATTDMAIESSQDEVVKPNVTQWDPVRQVYADWCKQYGKKMDDVKYQTFATNFLAAARRAAETGEELLLDETVDSAEAKQGKIQSYSINSD